MGRNKLERFRQNEINRNVIQPGKDIFNQIKGNWNKEQFNNGQPLVVELACGRGEFTVGLARQYPESNFVGVDIKGSRIWKGSTIAIAEGLENVAFLRSQIEQLDEFFAEGEIDELWITFPDPRPREGDEKKRLTSPRFLEMYKPMIKKGGIVHFKTDNTGLFNYTLEVLQDLQETEILAYTHDFYLSQYKDDHFGIQTRYEKMFSDQGEKIKYCKFRFL
ncbi:MAG TPA: tRNA (guanosine(46)-N7)-methyltransferase TrmB [Cyclobacteriaceae bacterium]|nr:tRNA (guanosine(46)-N7)-methyltransferase TrmB [Cyclobacteriaceae bacterium]